MWLPSPHTEYLVFWHAGEGGGRESLLPFRLSESPLVFQILLWCGGGGGGGGVGGEIKLAFVPSPA